MKWGREKYLKREQEMMESEKSDRFNRIQVSGQWEGKYGRRSE